MPRALSQHLLALLPLRPVLLLLSPSPSLSNCLTQIRPFSLSSCLTNKPLPPRLKIDDADLIISYLKGTGPGGQKINKTNSAVQLIHKPTGLVVKSQATRSRSQNEKIARQILADKVEQLLKGDQSRVAIKAERERKKKASRLKKSRRKYRELENGGQEQAQEQAQTSQGNETDGVKDNSNLMTRGVNESGERKDGGG